MKNFVRLLSLVAALAIANASRAAMLYVGPASPYKTIQAAMTAAKTGDTVRVYTGTYTGIVTITKNAVTLENYPSNVPRLIGRIDVGNRTNVTLRGLEITGWSGLYHGVFISGGAGLRVVKCKIHDGSTSSSASGVYARYSPRVIVESNDIYRCQKGVNIISSWSSNNTYTNGDVIQFNTIHDNPVDGVDIHGQYITINSNKIYNNINTSWSVNHPDGIQAIAAAVDGFTSVVHCVINNNEIRNHTQNIFLEGTAASEASNCKDVHIYNNVLYNDSATVNGVAMDQLSTVHLMIKYSRDVYIYNNTLGRSGSSLVHIQQCANGKVSMKNNIFDNPYKGGVYVEDPLDFAAGGMNYNHYYTAIQPVVWGKAFYASRAAFASATGFEVNGRDGNPLISVWPVTTLSTSSPCMNKGATLSDFKTDRAGILRPQGGAWDMGAYEHL